jgi:hypothetical protein
LHACSQITGQLKFIVFLHLMSSMWLRCFESKVCSSCLQEPQQQAALQGHQHKQTPAAAQAGSNHHHAAAVVAIQWCQRTPAAAMAQHSNPLMGILACLINSSSSLVLLSNPSSSSSCGLDQGQHQLLTATHNSSSRISSQH